MLAVHAAFALALAAVGAEAFSDGAPHYACEMGPNPHGLPDSTSDRLKIATSNKFTPGIPQPVILTFTTPQFNAVQSGTYGFIIVALGADNTPIGNAFQPQNTTQVQVGQCLNAGPDSYATHVRAGPDTTWPLWLTPPYNVTGDVELKAMVVASNSNDAVSGDRVFIASVVLTSDTGIQYAQLPATSETWVTLDGEHITSTTTTTLFATVAVTMTEYETIGQPATDDGMAVTAVYDAQTLGYFYVDDFAYGATLNGDSPLETAADADNLEAVVNAMAETVTSPFVYTMSAVPEVSSSSNGMASLTFLQPAWDIAPSIIHVAERLPEATSYSEQSTVLLPDNVASIQSITTTITLTTTETSISEEEFIEWYSLDEFDEQGYNSIGLDREEYDRDGYNLYG